MDNLRLSMRALSLDRPKPPTPVPSSPEESLLLHTEESLVGMGEMDRYFVEYENQDKRLVQSDKDGDYLWLRIRNHASNLIRPLGIAGPFSFYVDVTPCNYSRDKPFSEDIQYNSDVRPGQSFKAKLRLNDNSHVEGDVYAWTIDVVSQLSLSLASRTEYLFKIGYDNDALKRSKKSNKPSESTCKVRKTTSHELWSVPPPAPQKPVHLVVVTHGIFSNIGADMLNIRDRILEFAPESANLIVRGYDGNSGKNDSGVRYLGKRVGDYVMQIVKDAEYNITKISFIGHSLGGLVQAYAVLYITVNEPDFFTRIKPVNLITMASPMLGITEFPAAVSFALDIGMMGRTGRDLTLRHKFLSVGNKAVNEAHRAFMRRPVLEQVVVNKDAHKVFAQFDRRTAYANAIHDGIVPLRTAALLYLDWKGLGDIQKLKEDYERMADTKHDKGTTGGGLRMEGGVAEIPEDKTQKHVKPIVNKERRAEMKSDGKPQNQTERDTSKADVGLHVTSKKLASFFTMNTQRTMRKKMKKYITTQTLHSLKDSLSRETTSDTTESSPAAEETEGAEPDLTETIDVTEFHVPPVSSTFISAANSIISPAPAQSFLRDPATRFPAIFHDKVYSYSDLPPEHYHYHHHNKIGGPFSRIVSRNKKALQEFIARKWHEDMDWRKVLVTLRPDAHNNISVRRKYVNAWGWEVVDHLATEHFTK